MDNGQPPLTPARQSRRQFLRGMAGLGLSVAGLGLAGCVTITGRASQKVPRIGFLSTEHSPSSPFIESFRQGLRELGYIEGENILVEYRFAEGRLDVLLDQASDLVRLGVDVIVTSGGQPSLAAQRATKTVPIVFVGPGDPVGVGLVASLSRPGGNITGLGGLTRNIGGKRIELLKEMSPEVSRVAIVRYAPPSVPPAVLPEEERAAQSLGISLLVLEIRDPKEFEGVFEAAVRGRAGAIMTMGDVLMIPYQAQIVNLALMRRLPTIFNLRQFVQAGGLMSYGPSDDYMYRRAAAYVQKILRGARPADLPVERPIRFDLVVNMKTAQSLGLKIPYSILVQADEVLQ